jgi:hypothetical protein
MTKKPRPIGVTIVGALYLLLAIVAFVAATGFILWAGLDAGELSSQLPGAPMWLVEGGSFALTAVGLVVFLVAVVDLAIALGCFRGWGWVWSWALVFAILNILISAFNAFSQGFTSGAIVPLLIGSIIPVLVIVYLNTKKVKKFFRKA